MFNPLKSYSHPALRIHAEAWVVNNDWAYLIAKVHNLFLFICENSKKKVKIF